MAGRTAWRVGFPPGELQQQLATFSRDNMLEGDGQEVWTRLRLIFARMNTGGKLGSTDIHQFNGALFREGAAAPAIARIPREPPHPSRHDGSQAGGCAHALRPCGPWRAR